MQQVKKCPICGALPQYNKEDLGRENGRGYPGKFSINYSCANCRTLIGNCSNTIYSTLNEAEEQAVNHWNNRVEEMENYLSKKITNNNTYLLKRKITFPSDENNEEIFSLIGKAQQGYLLIIDNGYKIRQWIINNNLFYVHETNDVVTKICWYVYV